MLTFHKYLYKEYIVKSHDRIIQYLSQAVFIIEATRKVLTYDRNCRSKCQEPNQDITSSGYIKHRMIN